MQRLAEFVARQISSSRVLPSRNGASQSGEAASAASDRSGHALAFGAAQEDRPARAIAAAASSTAGAPSPRSRTPRASASALGSSAGGLRLPSASVERAEPAAAARAQRSGGAVERRLLARLDRAAGDRLDLVKRQRRGGDDARRGGAADDLADRQIRFAGERIVRLERRGAAVGHQEFAARCPRAIAMRSGNAAASHCADVDAACRSLSRSGEGLPAGERSARAAREFRASRRASSARGERSRRKASSRGVEVDRVAAEAAFGQHDGDLGGQRGFAGARRVDQHARQPRRQRQAADRAALVGDPAVAVERAELREQRARLLERRARRRIEEFQRRAGSATPQTREVERQAGEIGGENLRAARTARGRRSPPPPTAGSRRRGSTRPARPRRWSALARDTRTVSSRVRPTSGS